MLSSLAFTSMRVELLDCNELWPFRGRIEGRCASGRRVSRALGGRDGH